MGQTGSKPTLVTLVWALSSVFSGLERVEPHILKTACKLDGALYYQKEKLSNIMVKLKKKKFPLMFVTNINTFCQFSSHLSNFTSLS